MVSMEICAQEVSNSIVKLVLARAAEEIKLSLYFKGNLKKLVRKLEKVDSILGSSSSGTDSAAAETSSRAVQLWLREVEDIPYDAENMLDVLAFEKVRQKLARKLCFSKRLKFLLSPSNPVFFRWRMGRWVRRIDSAIQEAYVEARSLGLRPADLPSPAAAAASGDDLNSCHQNALLQETRDIPDTSFVIGRSDAKAAILNHVLCYTETTTLAAIVGLGGLGKTVLAQEVYEDEQVMSHFSERIWITVSRDFTIKKVLNDMVGFLKKSKLDCGSFELAIQTLKESLCGKTYLLVLDDLWDTNDQLIWDSLRSALRRISGSEYSRILVTTRDRGVAERMDASLIHDLQALSEDDSWNLFKHIALAKRPRDHDSVSLEEVGKRIAIKCRGVPLAIKTIAGMLVAKRTTREWEIVEKNKLWDAPQDRAGILPSLKLSYTYLRSPCLKRCFSSLAMYPKASCLVKRHLICWWMANGFLQHPLDQNSTMEDTGEEYFSTLLSIFFLQEREKSELGEIISFTMHDLVHDLATYVGKHEWLCLVLNAGDIRGHNVDKVKHLFLPKGHLGSCDSLVFGNLRSLQILGGNLPKGILLQGKYLRSLELCDMNIEEVPKSIAGMKCLKFLNLSRNPIKVLPDWIMALYNLQTLWLHECPNLICIPKELGSLVNLRHFQVNKFLELPTGVEQLSCVQTLLPLVVRYGGFQIAELGNLHHVSGVLEIAGLELIKSKQDAEMAHLSDKSRVEQLYLYWTLVSREDHCMDLDEEVLDGLYPNTNLRFLSIKDYGSKKFPEWVKRMDVSRDVHSQSQRLLRNLTKIELFRCTRCEELPTMGHLPCLKFLEISQMENLKQIGRELYCCEETIITGTSCAQMECFPNLEKLRLIHLHNLEEWREPEPEPVVVCFPRLESLVLKYCPKLRKTPNKFPSLKIFTVEGLRNGLPVSNIISNNTTLHALKISLVDQLVNLPEELSQCTSLQKLRIISCRKLTSVPDLGGLTSLHEVVIWYNGSLRCPLTGLKSCTSLQTLQFLDCPNLKAITEDLSGLGRLCMLYISGQTELITQPPHWLLNNLPRLKFLEIGGYVELDRFPDLSPLLKITSLVFLQLRGWPKLQSQPLPDQLERFNRLLGLIIQEFDSMEQLPEWLGNLSSLENLSLSKCSKLKRLPSKDAMKRLTKLSYLHIWKCPLLEESVKVNGAEHHKVAHIQLHFPVY